ncbi:hypothetical protein NH340_JMT03566 [Sarcoptes scabiei]|nr:hypothetical protein NH340_JMT03566 [Sarcoptes scabiei]
MNNIVSLDEEVGKHFTHVRVLHDFRGSNNDELCIKKNEIITLCQTPSGGWWEGTLNGLTGWFPSNYVSPVTINDPLYQKLQAESLIGVENANDGISHSPIQSTIATHLSECRSIVMKEIQDSESQLINSLQDAINYYLMPIHQSKLISKEQELNAVLRAISEICSVHRKFLTCMEKFKSVPYKENRMGGLFLEFASQFKKSHFEYCCLHSKFVNIIEKHNHKSGPSHQSNVILMPNVHLTSLLSVSFRHLDKYPALLQELQRYTDESHPDRGDIQRAGYLYREISMSCLELRRRKEMELEVMLGNIKNFDNLNIEHYGQIIKMEPILMLADWNEPKKDYYLVLFPKTLMILSVGKEMTSFTFESMMKLKGARLRIDNDSHESMLAFSLQITGHNANPCHSGEEKFNYVLGFTSEEILSEIYTLLEHQIQNQSNQDPTNSFATSSLIGLKSNSRCHSSSSSSSSIMFSPQSSLSMASQDQSTPMIYSEQAQSKTLISDKCNGVRSIADQTVGIETVLQSLPQRCGYWSDNFLSPSMPHRQTDINRKMIEINKEPSEDMQLLNVIDAYHRKFKNKFPNGITNDMFKSIKTLNETGELESEDFKYVEILNVNRKTHEKSNSKTLKKKSLSSLLRKIDQLQLTNSERNVFYAIHNQLRSLNSELDHLAGQINAENRQRKEIDEIISKFNSQIANVQ